MLKREHPFPAIYLVIVNFIFLFVSFFGCHSFFIYFCVYLNGRLEILKSDKLKYHKFMIKFLSLKTFKKSLQNDKMFSIFLSLIKLILYYLKCWL